MNSTAYSNYELVLMLIRQNGVRTEMTARGLANPTLFNVRQELNILSNEKWPGQYV